MSRLFAAASSEGLYVDSTPITAAPLSISLWFNVTAVNQTYNLAWIGNAGAASDYWYMLATNTGVLEGGARDSTFANCATSTSYSANTWHHGCYIESASNNRAILLDGGGKGTDATGRTPDGASRIACGYFADSSPGGYMDGLLAEYAIWNVALTDEEALILSNGYSPLFIRPQNLVFYLPLVNANDKDLIGGLSMSETGTPGISEHTRVIYPYTPMNIPFSATPASGLVIPVAIHNLVQQGAL